MKIENNGRYEMIVFANQEEGGKALRVLALEGIDHALVSTLAVVVPAARREELCRLLSEREVLIGGHFPYCSQDYDENLLSKASGYSAADQQGKFLEGFTLNYVAPCLADERRIRLIASLSRDVTQLLPYLNATIKGASYNKKAPTLSYQKGPALVNLYSNKVTVAKVDDIVQAWKLLGELQVRINDAYMNREHIRPSEAQRTKPGPFQIYGHLPKTNCQACGESTCLAFAARLIQGERRLEDCPPLREEPRWAENRDSLRQLTEGLGL